MDSRNPFSPKMKIASSSKQPTDTDSSRSVDAEIGSSSKQPIDIGSSRNVDAEIGSSSNRPRLEQTITKDTYLLNSEIVSFSNGNCPVYRALFSDFLYGTGRPFPRGYATLKIINMNLHEHRTFQPQNTNVIRCMKSFIASNSLCVSLPYMSEGSLRSFLSTRPEKKLPENFIPVVLKQVVVGLQTKLMFSALKRFIRV